MTFEEEFPSLKDKACDSEDWWLKEGKSFPTLDVEDVREHCLDKQRVREAIEDLWPEGNSNCVRSKRKFIKELGL